MTKSVLEEQLHAQLIEAGEQPERECKEPYRLATEENPRSRPKADFCFPQERVAIECEGGVWVQSKHSSGVGINRDCRKANFAALAGWTVLRFTSNMIRDKERTALSIIQRMLTIKRQEMTA